MGTVSYVSISVKHYTSDGDLSDPLCLFLPLSLLKQTGNEQ
jgi:hypothetical protein